MFEREIEELLKNGGASLVGFCQIEKSPIKNQDGLVYAVSIAYKLSDLIA